MEDTLVSSNPRIWAAGEITGHPEFVYVASAHGVTAVENAFHETGQRIDYTHLPRVTFTSPAVGAVGKTDNVNGHDASAVTRRAATTTAEQMLTQVSADIPANRAGGRCC